MSGFYGNVQVETIGDGYMCASGVPQRNGSNHAGEIANMALAFQRAIKSFKIAYLANHKAELRIGCHSGTFVAFSTIDRPFRACSNK